MSDEHVVDFLQKEFALEPERVVRTRFSRTRKFVLFFLVVGAAVGIGFSARIAQVTHGDEADVGSISLFSSLSTSFARLVGSSDKALTGEVDDRINFLLLGVGGDGHDGPQLADSIMFGSFKPSTRELALFSLPRDLVVDIPGYGLSKINAANAYGEQDGNGQGLDLTAQVVSTITGQPIHYVARIDFSGFSTIVDQLGGVNVYVDRPFTDNQYPEYEGSPTFITVSFSEGWMHMDGETALQLSRSRHGNNGEGTDFARATRQQKVLLAMKERALSLGVLLNPAKLTGLLNTVTSHIRTNVSFWEMARLAHFVPEIDPKGITVTVADTTNGLVYLSSMTGLGSVALPSNDDWSDFQRVAANLFSPETESSVVSASSATTHASATTRVAIYNGTSVSGLAYATAARLDGSVYEVVSIDNAQDRNVERTTIYDYTSGKKALELAALQQFLDAEVVMTTEGWTYSNSVVPDDLTSEVNETEEDIDFLIVVGQDATSLAVN